MDSSYIVVDTETTGIDARRNRVIEIGAVRIRNGAITDRFETLVNPGVSVPTRITRLTGIATAHLAGAPSSAEAVRAFEDFAGDAVRVAHNARFDRAFLAAELARAGLDARTDRWICTVRLARRLLPGLPSKRLPSVAAFLGVPVGVRHRALADALVTGEVFLRLVERYGRLWPDVTEEALMTFQERRYASVDAESRHVRRIRQDVIPTLPETPGVYRFLDRSGRLLYVGKALSLRDRVGSYFSAQEAKTSRIRALVQRVRSVEVEPLETELHALLHEARTIRELQPPYNRALLKGGTTWWVRADPPSNEPVISVRRVHLDDQATWIGPLRSEGQARNLATIASAAYGFVLSDPAVPKPRRRARTTPGNREGAADRFRPFLNHPLHGVANLLTTDAVSILTALQAAMQMASSEMEFEEAALLRDWMETVERSVASPVSSAEKATEGERALVLRAESGPHTVALLRVGRLVGVIAHADGLADDTEVFALVSSNGEREAIPRFKESGSARVVSEWAYRNRKALRCIERVPGESDSTFAARILGVLAAESAPA